jgi:hypothetical protein
MRNRACSSKPRDIGFVAGVHRSFDLIPREPHVVELTVVERVKHLDHSPALPTDDGAHRPIEEPASPQG